MEVYGAPFYRYCKYKDIHRFFDAFFVRNKFGSGNVNIKCVDLVCKAKRNNVFLRGIKLDKKYIVNGVAFLLQLICLCLTETKSREFDCLCIVESDFG